MVFADSRGCPCLQKMAKNLLIICITTASRPTPRSVAALRGKVIGGAADAEGYSHGHSLFKDSTDGWISGPRTETGTDLFIGMDC